MLQLIVILSVGYLIKYSEGQCTWPADFQSSTWIDSEKGDMVFQTSDLTGWEFTVQVQQGATSQTLNTWECVTYNDTYLVMKTKDTFIQFAVNVYKAYRCLKLIKLTDNSYRYYEITPQQTNLDMVRLHLSENQGLTSISDVCFPQFQAEGSEFKLMLKSGFESAAKVNCPYDFLANHTFRYTASSTANSCSSTDTGLADLCTNNTELASTSPTCVTTSFYTASSSVWCMDVVPVGTDIFIALYNGQQNVNTLDGTTYTQFACIGVDSDNTQISVTPHSCKPNQTPGAVPVDNQGNSNGAVLAITASSTACPPCPFLSNPFRGNVTIATSGAITTATYACEDNYTLSGDSTRTCQSNGTWSGTTPSCACAVLANPTNGTVTTSTDGLAASHSCNVGSVLVGTVNLTCDTVTNLWSDTPPTCNDCQTLAQPANGSLSLASTGLTSVVTYACDVGTTLNGAQTRVCQTTGAWDSSAPTCTYCTVLADPTSGNVTLASDGSLTTATYLCANGYSMQGSNTATCDSTGVWDTAAPTCICDAPLVPANGSVDVSSDLTSSTYTCDVGTSLNGSVTRTCQTDGTGWTSTDPVCVPCPVVSAPTNGTYTRSTNGTVTVVNYSCGVGTSLTGESTAYCMADGTWSSVSPNCSECDAFSSPTSGNFTLSTDGTTTTGTVSCDVGTSISAAITISCLENGTWSTTNTSISCVSCPDLGTLTSGLITLTSNGTVTTAVFQCAQGYGVVGDTSATCQSDGTWSAATPTCVYTGASTEDSDDGTSLLPAVIVLAVLATAFAVAFGILLCFYFKSKRENELKASGYDQHYDIIQDDIAKIKTTKKLPKAQAPMDHQRHVLGPDTQTTSRAPSGFSFKDSFGISESVTPRSLASTTLPLHLVRESTSSSVFEQPPAPWAGNKSKSTTPRTPRTPRTPMTPTSPDSVSNPRTPMTPTSPDSVSNPRTPMTPTSPDSVSNPRTPMTPTSPDSVSNPRTPRKGNKSPRKSFDGTNTTTLISLEESMDLREEAEPAPTLSADNIAEARRKKKKKGILVKANSMRSKNSQPEKSVNRSRSTKSNSDKHVDDNTEADVPAVDINEELNSSRRFYSSMLDHLTKQENVLDKVLNGSSVRQNGSVSNGDRQTTDRRGEKRGHSTSPSVRATTPIKHSMQVNDPQSCITPRSNAISTVE